MVKTACVPEQDLRAFVLGELPERIEQYVTDHLEQCPACERAVERLDTLFDPALAALRRALRPDTTLEPGGAQTTDVAPPSVPERVGNCTILEELGRGGMGVVYKARQDRPERIVALKVLLAGRYSGAERRARFNAEADAIARLHHPHIVQVHEASEQDGLPYLVLEYCAGGNLAQRLEGKPQTPRDAVHWLDPLVQGVAHAHQAGVVHRDLKPANVLLAADGQVKISDFGLARAERPELTATGAVLGTPSYMAPEQASGRKDVGPAADVYALGAILYEMLTGRPPFQGASALETLAQVRSQEPVPPSRWQPTVPRDLETICLTCLQKTPAKRYASAAALGDDLRRFQDGRPIHARPTGAVEKTWRWARRNPAVASLAGLVLLALTGGIIGTTIGLLEARDEAWKADQERTAAQAAKEAETVQRQFAEKQAKELRENLYRAELNLASNAAELDRGLGRVSKLLAGWERSKPDLRGWEWYYLYGLCHRDVLTVPAFSADPNAKNSVAWSPDGTRLAAREGFGKPRVFDAATGKETVLLEAVDLPITFNAEVAWSPDGRRLAGLYHGGFTIWDAYTGKTLLTAKEQSAQLRCLAWAPDGTRLAFSVGGSNTIKVCDAATGKERLLLKGHTKAVNALAWSADASRLASGGVERTLFIWDTASGKQVKGMGFPGLQPSDLSWSPDGTRVAGAYGTFMIVWGAVAGKEVSKSYGTLANAVSWSPDGTCIATGGRDGLVRIWSPASSEKPLNTLKGHSMPISSLAWNPAGTRLASAATDGTVKIWDPVQKEEPLLLGQVGWDLLWRPDGKRLAAISDNFSAITILDPATAGEVARLTGHKSVSSFSWSPDGARLASNDRNRNVLKVWDVAMAKECLTMRGKSRYFGCVAWSPNGIWLASTDSDGMVQLWNSATGEQIRTWKFAPTYGSELPVAVWNNAGTHLAVISYTSELRVFDAATGKPTCVITGHQGLRAAAWSPDGESLASGSDDAVIKIWDAATGKERGTLYGHTGPVVSVSWNPDGARLASFSGSDGTSKIWDPVSGKELLTLKRGGKGSASWRVAWSPDGRCLAAPFLHSFALFDAGNGYRLAAARAAAPE